MASGVSGNLRLELLVQGEGANTWGTSTNNNLKILERSISGVADVAVSSPTTTLSSTDWALDTWHHMGMRFTGTLTANTNVVVPAFQKMWIAENATSGSYSLTVKTSGGTGVAIPSGQRAVLVGDGTNVTGTVIQAYDPLITSYGSIGSNGLVARTGAGTVVPRTLTGTTNQVSVANGDGSSGNPTIGLPSALTAPGSVTTSSALTVLAGGAAITGNSSVTGTLAVSAGLSVAAGGAAITGNSAVTGTFGVSGTTTLGTANITTAGVSGTATVGTLSVTGTATIAGGATAATLTGAGTAPFLFLNKTNGGTDSKLWFRSVGATALTDYIANDANSVATSYQVVTRSSNSISSIALKTGSGTDALVIDANQNVGIANTPVHTAGVRVLLVKGPNVGSGFGSLRVETGLNTKQALLQVSGTNGDVDVGTDSTNTTGDVNLWAGGATRARMQAAGIMMFGQVTTTTPGYATAGSTLGVGLWGPNGRIFLSQDAFSNWNANYDGTLIAFSRSGTQVGGISVTTTTTTYATSSDYRLKENAVPLTGALDRLAGLQPYRFNFIAEPDRTVDGFFAHEVAPVVPEAVIGEHDDVDFGGNAVYQSIDQAKLVPLLVAALQELAARVEQLESQLEA